MHFYYKMDKKPYSCQAQERNLLEKVQGRTAKRLERLTFFLCTAKDIEAKNGYKKEQWDIDESKDEDLPCKRGKREECDFSTAEPSGIQPVGMAESSGIQSVGMAWPSGTWQ